MNPPKPIAANEPFRLPPRLFHARCTACWATLGIAVLVVASFWSLDLRWRDFFSGDAVASMGRFVAEFFPPDTSAVFLSKLWNASLETLAMSALGTLLAAVVGLVLAVPASRLESPAPVSRAGDDDGANAASSLRGIDAPLRRIGIPRRRIDIPRRAVRVFFNAMRSVPELVWASLLLIAAGLGPMAGTLALALHTTGVLGRLFAEALENAPAGPAFALRAQGVGEARVFLYARLPQVLPQLLSYTLYRWENNIRAAAVLGVVGAGGLGQLLAFHMGLFHMNKTASILLAMLVLVAIVDAVSFAARRSMTR